MRHKRWPKATVKHCAKKNTIVFKPKTIYESAFHFLIIKLGIKPETYIYIHTYIYIKGCALSIVCQFNIHDYSYKSKQN